MNIDLVGDLSAPSLARRFVTAQLASLDAINASISSTDVVLVASELVTNSIQAGAQSVTVSVDVRADRIELEVADDAGGWPMRRRAKPDEFNGRGLAITHALADDISITQLDPGKAVTVSWLRHG